MRTSEVITSCYLRSQSTKLPCWRSGHGPGGFPSSLAHGRQDRTAAARTARGPQGLAAEHRPHPSFPGSVILFNKGVEILRRVEEARGGVGTVRVLNCRCPRSTLV